MSLIIDASSFPSPPYFPYGVSDDFADNLPDDFPLSMNSIPSSVNGPSQPAPAPDSQLAPASDPQPSPQPTPVPSSAKPVLPQSAIIVLVSTIPIVAALVLIMAIIHCVRRRNKRRIAAQHQADIEKSLEMARKPVLTIDTDVPSRSARSGSCSAGNRSGGSGRVLTPGRAEFGMAEAPPVPMMPEQVYGGHERPRAWTRKSISVPGASGR